MDEMQMDISSPVTDDTNVIQSSKVGNNNQLGDAKTVSENDNDVDDDCFGTDQSCIGMEDTTSAVNPSNGDAGINTGPDHDYAREGAQTAENDIPESEDSASEDECITLTPPRKVDPCDSEDNSVEKLGGNGPHCALSWGDNSSSEMESSSRGNEMCQTEKGSEKKSEALSSLAINVHEMSEVYGGDEGNNSAAIKSWKNEETSETSFNMEVDVNKGDESVMQESKSEYSPAQMSEKEEVEKMIHEDILVKESDQEIEKITHEDALLKEGDREVENIAEEDTLVKETDQQLGKVTEEDNLVKETDQQLGKVTDEDNLVKETDQQLGKVTDEDNLVKETDEQEGKITDEDNLVKETDEQEGKITDEDISVKETDKQVGKVMDEGILEKETDDPGILEESKRGEESEIQCDKSKESETDMSVDRELLKSGIEVESEKEKNVKGVKDKEKTEIKETRSKVGVGIKGNDKDSKEDKDKPRSSLHKEMETSTDMFDNSETDSDEEAVSINMTDDGGIIVHPKRKRTPRVIRDASEEKEDAKDDLDMSSEIDALSSSVALKREPNLNMELLSIPFDLGWSREVVIRAVYDGYTKTGKPVTGKPADVYYFHPDGGKLRSMVQVAEYLHQTNSTLTTDNFSFVRKAISKPPFEIIRQAGRTGCGRKGSRGGGSPWKTPRGRGKGRGSSPGRVVSPRGKSRPRGRPPKLSKVEVVIERDTDEAASPTATTPTKFFVSPTTSTASDAVTATPPDVCTSTPVSIKRPREEEEETPEEAPVAPPSKKKAVARKSTTPRIALKKPTMSTPPKAQFDEHMMPVGQLCTLRCPGLEGIPPNLQCASCMCLFHPECVNFTGDPMLVFFCLICKQSMDTKHTAPTSVPGSNDNMQYKIIYPPASSVLTKASTKHTVTPPQVVSVARPPVQVTPPLPESVRRMETLNQNSGAIGALRSILDKRQQVADTTKTPPKLVAGSSGIRSMLNMPPISKPIALPPPLIQGNTSATSALNPNSLNTVRRTASKSTTVSTVTIPPPKLTVAPGFLVPVTGTTDQNTCTPHQADSIPPEKTKTPEIPLNAQLLTLPPAVTNRLKLSQPLALKINNIQIVVPPSCVISSSEGLKVLLPPNTFPLPSDPNQKLSVTVSNNSGDASETEASKEKDGSIVNNSQPLSEANKDGAKNSLPSTPKMLKLRRRGIDPSSCFIRKLYGGYDCMLQIFKHLLPRDLLSASLVCRTWHRISRQSCLWRHVRLRDITIPDWEKAAVFFRKVGVESLSLQGMRHLDDRNRTWHQLMSSLHHLICLREIQFGLVPASVLHSVCEKLTCLETFRAEFISDLTGDQMWGTPCKIDIGKFASLHHLKELKLRGVGGLSMPTFSFSGGLSELTSLKYLEKLSLTTLRSIPDHEFHFLRDMPQLKVLEVGDCSTWSSETFFVLGTLTSLQSLRLECGGEMPDIGLGDALQNLKKLEQLELIMFCIADTIQNAFEELPSLKSLVIWPDTTTEAAAMNSNTLSAILKLTQLKRLEWGVITNRDKVPGQDEDSGNKTGGSNSDKRTEMIPFLQESAQPGSVNADVALVPNYINIVQLTEKVCQMLPNAEIKVFSTKVLSHQKVNGSSS